MQIYSRLVRVPEQSWCVLLSYMGSVSFLSLCHFVQFMHKRCPIQTVSWSKHFSSLTHSGIVLNEEFMYSACAS